MATSEDVSTRGRLLLAARELLATRGFAGVTTRAIAERAGVNNALVHYYFRTKTALLVEAALSGLQEDVDEPARLLGEAATVSDGLADVIRWIASLDLADPHIRVLIDLTVEAFRNEEVRPVVAAALEEGRAQLGAALAQRDDVDSASAPALGALLAALFDGVMLHRLVDGDLDVRPWASATIVAGSRSGAATRRRSR